MSYHNKYIDVYLIKINGNMLDILKKQESGEYIPFYGKSIDGIHDIRKQILYFLCKECNWNVLDASAALEKPVLKLAGKKLVLKLLTEQTDIRIAS